MSTQELQTTEDIDEKVVKWKADITRAWSKSIESIVNVGKLLMDANNDINNEVKYKELLNSLPFSISVATNLRRIAEHPVLSNKSFFGKLPAFVNTLYYLASVPEVTLKELIQTGEVHPYTKLAQAKKLAFEYGELVKDAKKTLSPRFEDMMEVGLIAIPKDADIDEFIPALDNFLASYQARTLYTQKEGSLADKYREIIKKIAEEKIEERKSELGTYTLDQVRMLDKAGHYLSQRTNATKKVDSEVKVEKPYPPTAENYQAIVDLIGMEVTSNNIRKWCKKNKVPNYLRKNNLEHEVYVWDLLRTYAVEEDGYKTFKTLEQISEGEKVTAGVKAAAQEALKIAMKFENPRKPRAERKPAKNDAIEDAAE